MRHFVFANHVVGITFLPAIFELFVDRFVPISFYPIAYGVFDIGDRLGASDERALILTPINAFREFVH